MKQRLARISTRQIAVQLTIRIASSSTAGYGGARCGGELDAVIDAQWLVLMGDRRRIKLPLTTDSNQALRAACY